MPKTATRDSRPVFVRMSKASVQNAVKATIVCMMSVITGCGRKGGRRGICDSCYQTAYTDIRAGVIHGWEEVEAAGLCLPPKRQAQKRILRTLLARRTK